MSWKEFEFKLYREDFPKDGAFRKIRLQKIQTSNFKPKTKTKRLINTTALTIKVKHTKKKDLKQKLN